MFDIRDMTIGDLQQRTRTTIRILQTLGYETWAPHTKAVVIAELLEAIQVMADHSLGKELADIKISSCLERVATELGFDRVYVAPARSDEKREFSQPIAA